MHINWFAVAVIFAMLCFSAEAIFANQPGPLGQSSPCQEDEVLYPTNSFGELAYPEGRLTCVNIEEFAR